jgi:hypothetical protein
MKLPDFLSFEPLLIAKKKMGIARETLGDLEHIVISVPGLTRIQLESLGKEGLDVELDDVIENHDGTLVYKNKRVILYIRDVSGYGNFSSDPKFHISNCRTLRDMRQNNRFGRYVIANKDTGKFTVRAGLSGDLIEKRLDVCQNCLERLNFDGFVLGWDQGRRRIAVQNFSIRNFFERYPKTLHHDVPKYDESTAPMNRYSQDFAVTSRGLRSARGWRCEGVNCGVNLSDMELQKFLHVHHKDGQKSNDNPGNLLVLCIHCHALTYHHQHMRNTPDYREFVSIRSKLLRDLNLTS